MRRAALVATALFLALGAWPQSVSTAQVPVPRASTGQACTIVGTAGDDHISGTPGPDVICTLGGSDLVDAGAGDDVVDATASEFGIFEGGEGDDTLLGPTGDPGIDRRGVQLDGGPGNDLLTGGHGGEQLYGRAGNDLLRGNGGADTLLGGEDTDVLRGGAGRDSLFGGPGSDTLDGGAGRDYATYGSRNIGVVATLDAVRDDGKPGELDLVGSTIENVIGGRGNDRITGSDAVNSLQGRNGEDVLSGLAGDDYLWGDDGADTMRGGAGSDLCEPDRADDVLWNCERRPT